MFDRVSALLRGWFQCFDMVSINTDSVPSGGLPQPTTGPSEDGELWVLSCGFSRGCGQQPAARLGQRIEL